MKEEYKKELKSILELVDSKDIESKILGVSLFFNSKWVKDLKAYPNYEDLYIKDGFGNDSEHESLMNYFDCDFNDLNHLDKSDAITVSDLLHCLFRGDSAIVEVKLLGEFS